LIAVDWGTSNFRAFRLDEAGTIVDRRSFPTGILRVPAGGFAETLVAQVGEWISAGERRILLCGMVGSRQGWVEAGYVACPVGIDDLASRVTRVPFAEAEVILIPGVSGEDVHSVPEVMRGEETEVMGMVAVHGKESLVCLPGTHSKWVHLRGHVLVNFSTCMTGDVFDALQQFTILAHTIEQDSGKLNDDNRDFLRGVARSRDSGGLLHHLFGVRTLTLTGDLKQEASASYLSGLLIGHEVRSMISPGAHVHLVGAISLCRLYAQAIVACGGFFTLEDEDAAARGLASIGKKLQWT